MKYKDMFVGRNRCVAIVVLPLILFCVLGWVDNGISEDSIGAHLYLHKKPGKNHVATRLSDTIPFAQVEVPPIFEQCKAVVKDCEQRNCVDKKIKKAIEVGLNRLVNKDSLALIGKRNIKVQFLINKNGDVVEPSVVGVNTKIGSVIREVLSFTPSMNPGKEDGVQVYVLYENDFIIERKKKRKLRYKKIEYYVRIVEDVGQGNEVINNDNIAPFYISFCKKSEKYDVKLRRCSDKQIGNFIKRNFNISIIDRLGISGDHQVIVSFTVSKCGNVIDVKTKGGHPKIEKEISRIVGSLSQYIKEPFTYNKEPIDKVYTFPVLIKGKW